MNLNQNQRLLRTKFAEPRHRISTGLQQFLPPLEYMHMHFSFWCLCFLLYRYCFSLVCVWELSTFTDQKVTWLFFNLLQPIGIWETAKIMAGGAAPPPKQEELLPHPVKDQLPNIAYCITSPPPWRKFIFFALLLFLNFIV